MAEIVMGVASSHTPQLSSGADLWEDHAERDRSYSQLLGPDAEYHSYSELLEMADPGIKDELTHSVWEKKDRRCQAAIDELGDILKKARIDVAIVIGDDQRELFRDDGTPMFACFLGTRLLDWPRSSEEFERLPPGIRAASWAAHADKLQSHPTSPELTEHLVKSLIDESFDVSVFSEQPESRSLGHAFTFPRYRLGLSPNTPIAPIFINTYFPPNVPSAQRCYDLGRVISCAVQSWPRKARVAVVASGGLSHFVIDQELDRRILSALTSGDPGALVSLPRKQLRSGTSEVLNWIVAAGALEDLQATVLDYVAGYRSPAGTGTGMAFVYWQSREE